MTKPIAITGVQPSGELHLGNYLGVLRSLGSLGATYDMLVFVADLHSLTTFGCSRDASLNALSSYIACGVDPEKNILFIQSDVPAHAELCWILTCLAPYGHLSRMTQFKDKSKRQVDNINLGLLSYPVLMAADILLYNAQFVPAGDDQRQHLEFTRDLALLFNKKCGSDVLTVPEPLFLDIAARIMSLTDGSRKMSKTDLSDASRINMTDSDDVIVQKIKRAKTDSLGCLNEDLDNRPEVRNLLDIFSALSGRARVSIIEEYNDSGFARFKQDLADLVVNALSPIRNKIFELRNDQILLKSIAEQGRAKASNLASHNIALIKNAVGL